MSARIMARSCEIPTTSMHFRKNPKAQQPAYRGFSKLASMVWQERKTKSLSSPTNKNDETSQILIGDNGQKNEYGNVGEKSCWVPHYRTGIYFPEGQEWVMHDVPDNAASLGQETYWFRSVDGVDHPELHN